MVPHLRHSSGALSGSRQQPHYHIMSSCCVIVASSLHHWQDKLSVGVYLSLYLTSESFGLTFSEFFEAAFKLSEVTDGRTDGLMD